MVHTIYEDQGFKFMDWNIQGIQPLEQKNQFFYPVFY